jgi:cytochrome b6-f complex iron-sulfur subunit
MTDAEAQAAVEEPVESEAEVAESPPLSRREFLYYMWGASMAVFMAGSSGVTVWFLLPIFREEEFGGVFTIPVEHIPAPNSLLVPGQDSYARTEEGRFWLVNIGEEIISDSLQPSDYQLDSGLRALYRVCVHLGCLYKWVPTNDRFECPCHGSKYLASGARIDGPARRNLDQFIIQVVDADGEVLAQTEPSYPPNGANAEGTAVPIPDGAVELRIDTGRRVSGAPNTQAGGGV